MELEKRAAEDASRAKSHFLANMAHELKTPISAILGYSEMLEEEAKARGVEDMIYDIDKVRIAARHVLGLAGGILDLSKIEAGKMELEMTMIDVRTFVEDTVAMIKPVIDQNSNTFIVDVGTDIGQIRTDAMKLRQ